MRASRALFLVWLMLGCAESKPAERPASAPAPYEPPVEEESRDAITPEEYQTINDSMGRKMDVLNTCYEDEMKKRMEGGETSAELRKKFHGKVTVAMKIGRDGRPKTVDILEDSLESPVVNQCLIRTIKTFEFGALTGEAQFVYPISFAPQY